jgi:hypothetical protein
VDRPYDNTYDPPEGQPLWGTETPGSFRLQVARHGASVSMVCEVFSTTSNFHVDREPRLRYGKDQLQLRLSDTDGTSEIMKDLLRWKEWVTRWRSKRQEGAMLARVTPFLCPFVRSKPYREPLGRADGRMRRVPNSDK